MAKNASTKDPCNESTHLDITQAPRTTSLNDILTLVPTEIAYKIFSYLGYRDRARCAQVSKSWRVIADDNESYKNQFDRDRSDLPNCINGEDWASQQKWKLAYIYSYRKDFPHEEYTSIKAIPYHPSHAMIERYWEKRTEWCATYIATILHGVNKPWKTSWVSHLARQARDDGVSYEVEEILLRRGFLRGVYPLWLRGKDDVATELLTSLWPNVDNATSSGSSTCECAS